MRENIQNRIVNIVLPITIGKQRYFSGYILGQGIIITCRHAFLGKDKLNNKQKIKILSQNLDIKIEFQANNLKGLIKEKIVIFSSRKYDLVLLKYQNDNIRFNNLHTTELQFNGSWNGGGYPYFNRDNRTTNGYKHFSGTFEAIEKNAIYLTLKVNTELPKMEHWQEASGSPIFIQGKLAGILREYSTYKNKDGTTSIIDKELKAIYIKRLWDDPDGKAFKEIIESELAPNSSIYKVKLSKLFAKYPHLRDEVILYLQVDEVIVLDVLLRQNKPDIMDICVALREKKIDGATELLLFTMAYQYENNECFNQPLTEDKPYIDVPIVRVEACEFLMSAEDQRDPLFKRNTDITSSQEVLPGKYNIISPPEYGIVSNTYEDIMDNFLAGQGDYNSVVERVFGDFNKAKGRTYNYKKKEKVVIAMLNKSEGTYYWLLEVTRGNTSDLKQIFNSLPIKILNMAEDPDVEIDMEEEQLFSKLSYFIEG